MTKRDRALVRAGVRFGIRTLQFGLPTVWADERYDEADVDRIVQRIGSIVSSEAEHIAKHYALFPDEGERHRKAHPHVDEVTRTATAAEFHADLVAKGIEAVERVLPNLDAQTRAQLVAALTERMAQPAQVYACDLMEVGDGEE